jgi:hypothetical protein
VRRGWAHRDSNPGPIDYESHSVDDPGRPTSGLTGQQFIASRYKLQRFHGALPQRLVRMATEEVVQISLAGPLAILFRQSHHSTPAGAVYPSSRPFSIEAQQEVRFVMLQQIDQMLCLLV